jgi:hypothetical protein
MESNSSGTARLLRSTLAAHGFGINNNAETFRYNVQMYPEVISATYSGANTYTAAGSLASGIPPVVGPNLNAASVPLPANYSTWIYQTPYRRSYAESYNVTLQRDFGHGVNVGAGYVATRDVRPVNGVNINAAPPNGGKAAQPYFSSTATLRRSARCILCRRPNIIPSRRAPRNDSAPETSASSIHSREPWTPAITTKAVR